MSSISSLVAHCALGGLLLSMWGFVEPNLCAQEIKIKFVDGRNGKPLGNTCVNVWVGHDRKEATAIPIDSNGIATLRLTAKDSEVDTSHANLSRNYKYVIAGLKQSAHVGPARAECRSGTQGSLMCLPTCGS